jgi:hypothetical protein
MGSVGAECPDDTAKASTANAWRTSRRMYSSTLLIHTTSKRKMARGEDLRLKTPRSTQDSGSICKFAPRSKAITLHSKSHLTTFQPAPCLELVPSAPYGPHKCTVSGRQYKNPDHTEPVDAGTTIRARILNLLVHILSALRQLYYQAIAGLEHYG